MRGYLLSVLVASSFVGGAAALAAGCGGSDASPSGAPDGSTSSSGSSGASGGSSSGGSSGGGSSGGGSSSGGSSSGDAALPPFDAGVAPTGTRVRAGLVTLPGENPITTDGYVVYMDNADKNMKVVSLTPPDGGAATPVTVAQFNANAFVSVVGASILVWPSPGAKLPVSPLYAWSAAKGPVTIDSNALVGAGGLSADGSKIAFVSTPGNARAGTIVVANIDGTGRQVIETDVPTLSNLNLAGCGVTVSFPGGKSDKVAAAWCPAGSTTQTITVHTVANATNLDVATGIAPNSFASFVSDPAGSKLLTVFANPDGGVSSIAVVPTAGGQTTKIEDGDIAAFFTSTTVHYLAGTSYKSSPAVNPSPKALATVTGLNGIYPTLLPPDQAHVLLFTAQNSTTNGTDLLLVDTTTAGQTPKTLQATPTGALYGDAWTADSSRVLFVDGIQLIGGGLVGTLRAAPVATGVPTKVADNVWITWALGGSKITYGDNSANIDGAANFRTDIRTLDLAAAGAVAKLIVNQADANYYVTPDKTKIVYAYEADPASASPLNGLWVAPVP